MKETLRNLFQQKFNSDEYRRVVLQNLLHAQQLLREPQFLEETGEGDRIYGLGYLHDADGKMIGLYYTEVTRGDVRRKRVGFRKMMKKYTEFGVDAAIAVFADKDYWRLSYMCDLKDGATAAKRFSYVLGDPKGQYNTPANRLADLGGRKIVLDDLKNTFSVETLSKEFFDEYHRHYDHILKTVVSVVSKDPLIHDALSKAFADYVKKMMGRIVFLHFLQKKRWLNGDPEFLKNLFFMQPPDRRADFLEKVLEPLFFGVFNTEPQHREKLFRDEGWDVQLLKQWENLPYLNGGLFERDSFDTATLRLPASLFEELFRFMASYNFTVDENDPDDAEVGVDPEMLGKIFESLLEDNKAKGAFYTPKEIVRYMCKESLIAYLSSKLPGQSDQAVRAFVEQHELPEELNTHREALDAALREVKICDPAIGSGAFPMGLLNELWRCREAIEETASREKLKKEIIENNIYGVDIEKGAIDIARLRFWLSIVVDADKPEPLPNFDYKFMQGNSLIESFEGFDLSHISDRLKGGQPTSRQLVIGLDSHLSRQNLQRFLREYFSVTDHQQKANMRHAINEEVKTLIRESIGGTPASLAKLDKMDCSANQDFFLWHTWFKDIFDNGGFDIVIGNPPYIQLQADGGRLADLYSTRGYKSFDRRGDIYELFYEKGDILLQGKGVLCFITSNGWMKSQYGDNLRFYLAQYTNPVLLVDFNQIRLFDNAIVETNILMFKNEQNMFRCKACSFLNHDKQTVLADLANQVDKECSFCKFERTGSWTIAEQSEQDLKEKIENNGILLSRWNIEIAFGIKSGCNAGFIIDGTTRNWIYSKAGQTERMILDRTIYPILQGRNLKKYLYVFNDKYMIVTPKGYPIDKVPILKEYMLTNYDSLSSKSGSNAWYELQASPSEKMLKNMHKEKILWGEISDRAKFTYDDGQFFAEATTFMMTTEDDNVSLKYLLAILNSNLSEWYFHKIATTTGMGTNRWKKYKLEQLPVVKPTKEQVNHIVDLVDQILDKKRNNPNADTITIEKEINSQVYALYNLTPEEIAIIEQ